MFDFCREEWIQAIQSIAKALEAAQGPVPMEEGTLERESKKKKVVTPISYHLL